MNKILIIDDDRELCALMKRSVQSEHIEADFCNTGKEGLQKLKEQEYQLVVLDVMMPGIDGFETLEEIRKENSLPILMFTSKNDSASKVRGLRAGADDYLTKPFDMDELIARIASLIRRYTRFNQQAGAMQKLDFDGLQIDLENRSVTTENGTFELPPKEFELLLYCAKHQGKILTKQQIYEEVWGEEYFYDDSNIIIFITANDKESDMLKGYEVGGADYVTKPFSVTVLCKKVAAVFANLELRTPRHDLFDDGFLKIDFSEQSASLAGESLDFTPKEYRTLFLFVKNPRIILTKRQILEKLWDIDGDFVDEHTLTTIISRIRKKIETDERKYIKTAYGMGYQWIGGEPR